METTTALTQEINQLHADLCSALADPTRILILYLVAERSYSVNELAARLAVAQPTASRHLKILRERGLLRAARQGQMVEYSLIDPRLISSLDTLRAVLRDSLAYRANLMVEE